MSAPVLFDRRLAAIRLAVARHRQPASGPADFLLARALDDLDDRLAALTRRFAVGAALGDVTGLIKSRLKESGRIDRVVALSPVPGRSVDVVGDDERLPFAAASLDFTTSLLTLQAVNDLPGAFVQVRRALRPDGLYLAALAGGDTLTELRQVLLEAEVEETGGAAPRVAPFVDVRTLGSLMQRAGFALIVTDSDRFTVRYPSFTALIADLRALGWGNPLVERRPLSRRVVARAAALYGERFADADGRLRATFEIVSASGWAPDASQPKPARPGSATVNLGDALKAIAAESKQPPGD
jgi:SAM-dependent methyltransferase